MRFRSARQRTPTMSLIIPAYNEEKYIAPCLTHAARTEHAFLEILVVDNASTDRTRVIAEKFPGVRVVREDRRGVMHARQRGFREARGDILAFIDADTRMPRGWSVRVRRAFLHDPKLACISGPYVYHDLPRWRQCSVQLFWMIPAKFAYLATRYMVVGGNFAIRREVLERMKGFDTSIDFYGDDTDIARRAHAWGKVKFDSGLVMRTSGRRLAKQGSLKTGVTYIVNFCSEVLLHRPVTKKHVDVR